MLSHARLSSLTPVLYSKLKPLHFIRFQLYPFSATSTTAVLSPNHSNLLSLCSSLHSLYKTQQTHALAITQGLLPHSVSLCAALILNYATFASPEVSRILFESTAPFCKTAFLWNTLIRAYSVAGVYDKLGTYNRMIRSNIRPDDHTFPFVLKTCADYSLVQKGKEAHGTVVKVGFDADVFVGNTLLSFYSCCDELRDVRKVFDEMPERDVVSWNTLIGALSVNGFHREAIDLFVEMKSRAGLMPNSVTVVSTLPVCAELGHEKMARLIHSYAVKIGLGHQVTISNALIDVYAKCGNVGFARRVFDELEDNKNGVSWNSIITGLVHIGWYNEALDMFNLMIDAGEKPNGVTISSMLPVFVELECFGAGKETHGLSIRMGLDLDLFIANSLIDMYAKSGHPTAASHIFNRMNFRNVVSWNAMVANYAQNGQEVAAVELVREMQADGEIPNAVTFTNILPACSRLCCLSVGREIHARSIRTGLASDLFLSNALTDTYAKCGHHDIARNVFNVSLQDQISYNTLIVGYAQTSDCMESLHLFKEMEVVGMEWDAVSFVGVIAACANLSGLKKGKEIHGVVVRKLFHTHLFIANSLLDLYTKCGRIDLAQKVFERIVRKDTASWNTMIMGYGMLGEFYKAVDMFEAMREDNIDYDSVSYIAVLSACSHGGLVEKGKRYFHEMQAKNIKPTHMHYACIVDLFGRAGLMEEAMKLIRELPIEPDTNIWGALLGASRIHGNIDLAKYACEHLFVLKPEHSGYYICLYNMLAEAGRWEEAKRVRDMMKYKGAMKNPGCSWVQARDRVHTFLVGESVETLDQSSVLVQSG